MAIHAIRLSSSHSESAAAMVDLIGGTASLVRARGHDTITGVTVSKVGHRCSSLRTPATRRLGAHEITAHEPHHLQGTALLSTVPAPPHTPHRTHQETFMSRGAKALDPLADPDPQTGKSPPTYTQVRRTRRMLKDIAKIRTAYMNMVSLRGRQRDIR